jgi:alpha-1,4-digalacturonate transport system substrate-binding protein
MMELKPRIALLSLLFTLIFSFFIVQPVFAQATLRYLCYGDANECEVFRELLDRFEAQNSAIKVKIDKVAYSVIQEQLETRLEAGEGPDMARTTVLGGLNKYYLDLSPYIDTAYWEQNFASTLPWMRGAKDDKGIYGWMTQLTVTGPYINKTMFEKAGVDIPPAGATWDDWATAVAKVQKKLNLYSGMVMDRSGHRLAGPAMTMGANYFDQNGNPAVVDAGFKQMVQRMIKWHNDDLMPQDVWPAASGAKWKNGGDMFINEDVAFHMSGSWMIKKYASAIGDKFEWVAIPQPCGPGGCSGMPGGAAMVAFKHTKHPKEVAQVMAYLTSEPVLREYYERTLQIPAHKGLAEKGLDYGSDISPAAAAALQGFTDNFQKILPQAHALQGYAKAFVIFNATVNYVSQAITGDLSEAEAYQKIEEEIQAALKK